MTGLIVEGGASRTYFSIGVMDVLMKNKIHFDYICGTSAGISNAMNYASGQIGRGLEIALNYVPSKKYCGMRNMLNPKNRSLFNIEHVFREIPNKLVPYDYEAFKEFKGIAEAAVTNVETGKSEYLRVMPDDKSWKVLIASCSLPIMFPIAEIDGRKYMDGGITDAIPYMHAIELGCDKPVVILSRERRYVKTSHAETNAAQLFFRKYPNFTAALKNRCDMYNSQRKKLFELEKQGRVFIIEPTDTHKWRRTENHPDRLKAMYDEGCQAAEKRKDEILKFLSI